MKKAINTDKVPAPWGPWSPGFRAGDFVFVGGQGPIDPKTGKLKGSTIQEQTKLTLECMKAVLEAADAGMADVVKIHVLLSDLKDFDGMNEVYRTFFWAIPDPHNIWSRPQRTRHAGRDGAVAYTGK